MNVLLWSGMFLLFSIGGSIIELASLIGVPVSSEVHGAIVAFAVIVAVSGAALAFFAPPAQLVPVSVII